MPVQVTQLERAMNVLVFVQFSALLVFSAVLAGLDQFWTTKNIPGMWYLQSQNKWPELPPSGLGWLVAVGAAAWKDLVVLQKQLWQRMHLLSMSLHCMIMKLLRAELNHVSRNFSYPLLPCSSCASSFC
jgi:hypothetical protein